MPRMSCETHSCLKSLLVILSGGQNWHGTHLRGVTATLSGPRRVQVPLVSARRPQGSLLTKDERAKWCLGKNPDPNVTDHLVFETVYSFLQRWPNIRMRNGHNIVPGVIPKGTSLYHGTHRKQLPPGPEWVAMDPEYAYYFCWDIRAVFFQNECWYLTLATTRPLKIELIIWEKYALTLYLKNNCRSGIFVNGFNNSAWTALMGMDFEIMLCDFTSGVSIVSFVNLEPPKGVLLMMPGFVVFEAINASSWHNRLPGETRIQLNLAGLVSFYDTQLVPSLVPIRAGQERWDHRVANISSKELFTLKLILEAALTSPFAPSSGVDWKTLFQVIVDRFAGRFELVQHFLNALATTPDDILNLANKTQTQLQIMLTPYLLLSAMPIDPPNQADMDWAIPIYRHCATTHTYTMESALDSMTYSLRNCFFKRYGEQAGRFVV